MHHTTASSDGTRIAYELHGDGPPVVLVAGIFCTRATLRPLAEALAGRARVAVYDRRGRGYSDPARPGDAIRRFLADTGMPEEELVATAADPAMRAVAPTMPYDLAVMGDHDGGTIPEGRVRAIVVPTLVVAGGASPAFFRTTAERLAALLPHGELAVLDGHDHGAPADAVAPVVGPFLAG